MTNETFLDLINHNSISVISGISSSDISTLSFIRTECEKRYHLKWKVDEHNKEYLCEDGLRISFELWRVLHNEKNKTSDEAVNIENNVVVPILDNKKLYEQKLKEFLYVDDSLISSRISIDMNHISVNWYKYDDICDMLSFWKRMFTYKPEKLEIINNKNKELWLEANAVAKVKKLAPVPPPCNYKIY